MGQFPPFESDVSPIKNGDFHCHVSFLGCNGDMDDHIGFNCRSLKVLQQCINILFMLAEKKGFFVATGHYPIGSMYGIYYIPTNLP